ncbi:MAG: hypothetical protein ACP5T3_01200 [Candidatus Micrarchaeia archaeon]
MEKKKLIELIGSLFVAFIFISSYAAYGIGSGSGGAKPNRTSSNTTLYYGAGFTTANVENYSSVFSVSMANCTARYSALFNATLQNLSASGSIAGSYQAGPSLISIEAGNESASKLLNYLSSISNKSCTRFLASAIVELPSNVSFYFSVANRSIALPIPESMRYGHINVLFSPQLKTVNVSVSALVTEQGIIRNISVSSAG